MAFVASLVAVAAAASFPMLLIAFVAFFPASGAFVSLTQASLMDAATDRRDRYMAAWTLAGSVGALAGPPVLLAVLAAGGSWRHAFLIAAMAGAVALVGTTWAARLARSGARELPAERSTPSTIRDVLAAIRSVQVVRWLILLEVSDLMLDVLTGFLAIYLVDVAHASTAWAATAVAVRLGFGLVGEAALIPVLGRVSGRSVLITSALIAGIAYPAFLVVPGLGWKLVMLAVLTVATSSWYPVLTAGLYDDLDGRSGVAVTLSSAAALVGATGPLVLGLVAQTLGLEWAMAGLAAVPLVVLAGLVLLTSADSKHSRKRHAVNK
jgi:FSR family fosmidomycin resistance protein-like MFS transporter